MLQQETQVVSVLVKSGRRKYRRNFIYGINTGSIVDVRCSSGITWVELRSTGSQHGSIRYWTSVWDQKQWPESVTNHQITFGEMEIRTFSNRLQLYERQVILGFTEYLWKRHIQRHCLCFMSCYSQFFKWVRARTLVHESDSQLPTRASLMPKTVSHYHSSDWWVRLSHLSIL